MNPTGIKLGFWCRHEVCVAHGHVQMRSKEELVGQLFLIDPQELVWHHVAVVYSNSQEEKGQENYSYRYMVSHIFSLGADHEDKPSEDERIAMKNLRRVVRSQRVVNSSPFMLEGI